MIMKKLSIKSIVCLMFQIIFLILTFVGGILLFIGKMNNAGMSICCAAMSVAFRSLYNSSKSNK